MADVLEMSSVTSTTVKKDSSQADGQTDAKKDKGKSPETPESQKLNQKEKDSSEDDEEDDDYDEEVDSDDMEEEELESLGLLAYQGEISKLQNGGLSRFLVLSFNHISPENKKVKMTLPSLKKLRTNLSR